CAVVEVAAVEAAGVAAGLRSWVYTSAAASAAAAKPRPTLIRDGAGAGAGAAAGDDAGGAGVGGEDAGGFPSPGASGLAIEGLCARVAASARASALFFTSSDSPQRLHSMRASGSLTTTTAGRCAAHDGQYPSSTIDRIFVLSGR